MCVCVHAGEGAYVHVCVHVCVCDGGGNINACDLVSDPVEVVRTYLHMNLLYTGIVCCGKCPFCTC